MSLRTITLTATCRGATLFLVSLAILAASLSANANKPNEQIDLRDLLVKREFKLLDDSVLGLEQAFAIGELSERQFGRAFTPLYKAPAELEPLFQDWIAASSQPTLARMVRGAFYHEQGWRARGSKFASETPAQQIERMTLLFNQAQTDLRAVLSENPDCALCYGPLVNIAAALGQSEEKSKLFQRAIKRNPKAYWVVHAYFSKLSPQWGGSPNEAQEFLQWFRKNYPNNPAIPVIEVDLLMEQVDTYVDSGEHQFAQPLIQRALALDPLHKRAWVMQSWILDQARDYPGALNAAENAIQNGADDDWTLSHRAQLLIKLGRAEEGIQALEHAADGPTAFRAGLRVLAGTLHNQKPDYARMWEFCQRGMQAGLPEAFACTGSFYYFGWTRPVDFAEALKWWKVAADRGVPESMVDVGILYWEGRGTPRNKEEAIAYWVKGAHAGDSRGIEKLRAHLSPWEFYTQYTLPTFEREAQQGEAGDTPFAVFGKFIGITWDGPIGRWIVAWVLPILLGLLLAVLFVIRRKRSQ